jgi:asparagine synthase (glutamine-hydrolysing)
LPGIVGIITSRPAADAERELRQMVEALCHEPFYVSGTWTDPSHGIYVGWVARKGSFASAMPVQNESGEVTLVFSGEEFPEPSIISSLQARGHAVGPGSASYLVHRYEDEPDFPKSLNGRFHGLVSDRKTRTATLFNDRYGLQKLYYHEGKDAFYFSAEAKAILKVRPELRTIDPRSLGEFVVCGCVLENRSLFPGIQVMPPGSAWLLRAGKLDKKTSYFQPREWEEETPYKEEEYYPQLREAFVRNLSRYFN